MFSFKVFLLFWVRAVEEKVGENESILARKRQLLQLVLVLAKCEKISNLFWAEENEVSWMISDYWRGHFMDLAEKW